MSQDILLTIIVPLYNNYEDVRKCILGLRNQDSLDFEVILVDDGGDKQLPDNLNLELETDPKLNYFYKEHGGPGAARNYGVKRARGKYILFLDSDDQLDDIAISRLLATIKKQNETIDLVIFGFHLYRKGRFIEDKIGRTFYGKQMEFVGEPFFECYKKFLINAPWNKLIRRDLLVDNKIFFDENLMILEDLLFSLEIVQKAENIIVLNEALYHYYYLQPDSLTSKYNDKKELAIVRVYKELIRTTKKFPKYHSYYSKDIAMKLFLQLLETKNNSNYSVRERLKNISGILRIDQMEEIARGARGENIKEKAKIKILIILTKIIGK